MGGDHIDWKDDESVARSASNTWDGNKDNPLDLLKDLHTTANAYDFNPDLRKRYLDLSCWDSLNDDLENKALITPITDASKKDVAPQNIDALLKVAKEDARDQEHIIGYRVWQRHTPSGMVDGILHKNDFYPVGEIKVEEQPEDYGKAAKGQHKPKPKG